MSSRLSSRYCALALLYGACTAAPQATSLSNCPRPEDCGSVQQGLTQDTGAQLYFYDGFESGTILTTDSPPGAWDQEFVPPPDGGTTTLSVLPAAEHQGAYGLRMADNQIYAPDWSGNGLIVHNEPQRTGDYYLRTWLRLSNGTTEAQLMDPIAVYGNQNGILFLRIATDAGYIVGIEGFTDLPDGTRSYYVTFSNPPAQLMQGVWNLVELGLTGVGTDAGTASAWLNGTLVATQDTLWNLSADDAVGGIGIGEPFADPAFMGTLDFDDVRASDQPMANHIASADAGPFPTGVCTPLVLELLSSVDALEHPLFESAVMTLSLSDILGTVSLASDCQTPVSSFTWDAGIGEVLVYLQPSAVGSGSLQVNTPDLLPSSVPILATMGPPSVTDAGSIAVSPVARTPIRGWSCQTSKLQGAWSFVLALLLSLVALRVKSRN